MSRSTRFFEIIQILRKAKAPVTAMQLAEALEVTPRTVYRDMASLQAMRLPILGEAGIGYVMRAGYDLPPLMFSRDEVEAVVVGLALLGRTGDRGLERAARNAARKIADVVPDAGDDPVTLSVSTWNRIPEPQVDPADVRRAIRDADELEIQYLDLQGRRTSRAIRPVALTYHVDSVVLAAWCGLRQAFRNFRVDRIERCVETGVCFADEAAALRTAWSREVEQALP